MTFALRNVTEEREITLRLARALDATGVSAQFDGFRYVSDEPVVHELAARCRDTGEAVLVRAIGPEGGATARRDFVLQALASQQLDHPRIARACSIDEAHGWLVALFGPGARPLAGLLEPGRPVDRDRAWIYLADLAAALEYLHSHDRAHGDLRPETIWIDDADRVVIAGPRLPLRDPSARSAHLDGSAETMAPELAAGRAPSPASDVYAFGVIARILIEGASPFAAPFRMRVIHNHLRLDPPSLAGTPGVEPELAILLDRALSKEPARRPSARALARALGAELAPAVSPDDAWRLAGYVRSFASSAAARLALGGAALWLGLRACGLV